MQSSIIAGIKYVVNTIESFFLKDIHQQNSSFNRISTEMQLICLRNLTTKELLLTASLVCHEWKVLASDESIWSILCKQLGVTHPSFHHSSQLGYRYGTLMYKSSLELKRYLGKEVCEEIEKLPVWPWPEMINGHEKKDFPHFSIQTYDFVKKFEKVYGNHFFKADIAGYLALILIPSASLKSKILVFNSSYSSSKQEEMVWWEWGLFGHQSGFYVDRHQNKDKQLGALAQACSYLQQNLCELFSISYQPSELNKEYNSMITGLFQSMTSLLDQYNILYAINDSDEEAN